MVFCKTERLMTHAATLFFFCVFGAPLSHMQNHSIIQWLVSFVEPRQFERVNCWTLSSACQVNTACMHLHTEPTHNLTQPKTGMIWISCSLKNAHSVQLYKTCPVTEVGLWRVTRPPPPKKKTLNVLTTFCKCFNWKYFFQFSPTLQIFLSLWNTVRLKCSSFSLHRKVSSWVQY